MTRLHKNSIIYIHTYVNDFIFVDSIFKILSIILFFNQKCYSTENP